MSKRNQLVSLKVHKSFFDSIFEPERKSLGIKIGRGLGWGEFTQILATSKAMKFSYPRQKKQQLFKSRGNKLCDI